LRPPEETPLPKPARRPSSTKNSNLLTTCHVPPGCHFGPTRPLVHHLVLPSCYFLFVPEPRGSKPGFFFFPQPRGSKSVLSGVCSPRCSVLRRRAHGFVPKADAAARFFPRLYRRPRCAAVSVAQLRPRYQRPMRRWGEGREAEGANVMPRHFVMAFFILFSFQIW
jgi:hypothetical protein